MEEIEKALFKLQSDVSDETKRYIDSKGKLIRLPMQARNKQILALIATHEKQLLAQGQKELWDWLLDDKSYMSVIGSNPDDYGSSNMTVTRTRTKLGELKVAIVMPNLTKSIERGE